MGLKIRENSRLNWGVLLIFGITTLYFVFWILINSPFFLSKNETLDILLFGNLLKNEFKYPVVFDFFQGEL